MITTAGIFLLVMLFSGLTAAKEPTLPNVTKALTPEKELRISKLSTLSLTNCFQELKKNEVLSDKDFSNKTAYACFKARKSQAFGYILDRLNQPAQLTDGETVIPNYDLYAAKAVSIVFASDAEELLVDTYRNADDLTKANILYVLGQMSGTQAKNLLIEALNDQSVYEETSEEFEGIPLRICDMAYNQLRLRYADELVDLPRTISKVTRIETRDDYIDEMISRF